MEHKHKTNSNAEDGCTDNGKGESEKLYEQSTQQKLPAQHGSGPAKVIEVPSFSQMPGSQNIREVIDNTQLDKWSRDQHSGDKSDST